MSPASVSDAKRFRAFHRHLLESGIYLPPSRFRAAFVGAAHSEGAVQFTEDAIRAFDTTGR
jgi:glutamate-1-semialdehyde 2,1-aminomutase